MRAPWHLWAVGLVTLLWNAVGAADYVMTQIQYAPYMEQFSPEQLDYFRSFPIWVQASWALAIWLSVAGSLLLLLRSRFAGTALGLAVIFMVVTAIHNFILADVSMSEIAGTEALIFTAVIFAIAVVLWIYARLMRQKGVLT